MKSKMLTIKNEIRVNEKLGKILDKEFDNCAIKNGLICNYTSFAFVARENDEIVGIITGYAYYREVHVGDLVVIESCCRKGLGSKLLKTVENFYENKGYTTISLSTYDFQAPEFYKKCGFQIEFIRENKEYPKLTKYFFIKYLN